MPVQMLPMKIMAFVWTVLSSVCNVLMETLVKYVRLTITCTPIVIHPQSVYQIAQQNTLSLIQLVRDVVISVTRVRTNKRVRSVQIVVMDLLMALVWLRIV